MTDLLEGTYTAKVNFIPFSPKISPAALLLEVTPEQYGLGHSEAFRFSLLETAASLIRSSLELPPEDDLYNYYKALRHATVVPHQVTIELFPHSA